MKTWTCDCVPAGQMSPHRSEADCQANREATGRYMAAINAGNLAGALATARNAELVAGCRLLGCRAVEVGGDPTWDVAIGTQYDRSIVALRSRSYRETSYGDVVFVRPGQPRYDELATAARQ